MTQCVLRHPVRVDVVRRHASGRRRRRPRRRRADAPTTPAPTPGAPGQRRRHDPRRRVLPRHRPRRRRRALLVSKSTPAPTASTPGPGRDGRPGPDDAARLGLVLLVTSTRRCRRGPRGRTWGRGRAPKGGTAATRRRPTPVPPAATSAVPAFSVSAQPARASCSTTRPRPEPSSASAATSSAPPPRCAMTASRACVSARGSRRRRAGGRLRRNAVDSDAAATGRGVVLHQLRLGARRDCRRAGLPGLFVLLAAHRREELAQGSVLLLRRRRGRLVRRHGPRRGRRTPTRRKAQGSLSESVVECPVRGGVACLGRAECALRSCVLVDATFWGKH